MTRYNSGKNGWPSTPAVRTCVRAYVRTYRIFQAHFIRSRARKKCCFFHHKSFLAAKNVIPYVVKVGSCQGPKLWCQWQKTTTRTETQTDSTTFYSYYDRVVRMTKNIERGRQTGHNFWPGQSVPIEFSQPIETPDLTSIIRYP